MMGSQGEEVREVSLMLRRWYPFVSEATAEMLGREVAIVGDRAGVRSAELALWMPQVLAAGEGALDASLQQEYYELNRRLDSLMTTEELAIANRLLARMEAGGGSKADSSEMVELRQRVVQRLPSPDAERLRQIQNEIVKRSLRFVSEAALSVKQGYVAPSSVGRSAGRGCLGVFVLVSWPLLSMIFHLLFGRP